MGEDVCGICCVECGRSNWSQITLPWRNWMEVIGVPYETVIDLSIGLYRLTLKSVASDIWNGVAVVSNDVKDDGHNAMVTFVGR